MPTRAAPAPIIACTSSSVSMPPEAFTPTPSGRASRISSTSWTDAFVPRPVHVRAKSAPTSVTILQASRFTLSFRRGASMITFTMTSPRASFAARPRTVRTTRIRSSRTALNSPASIAW